MRKQLLHSFMAVSAVVFLITQTAPAIHWR